MPGRYSMRVIRPPTGERFMCTSIGERKIVTWFQLPGRGPAAVARAGNHHFAVGRRHHDPGIGRNGSIGIAEEIGEEAAEQRRTGAPRRAAVSAARPSAGTSAPAMNGYPARSIFMERQPARKAKAGRARCVGAHPATRICCRRSFSPAPSRGSPARGPAAADDVFHLILQVEFSFLEGDFFELFRFREVVSVGQGV